MAKIREYDCKCGEYICSLNEPHEIVCPSCKRAGAVVERFRGEPTFECVECRRPCKPIEIVYDYGENGNYGVTGRYHHTGHYESDCCGAEHREVD